MAQEERPLERQTKAKREMDELYKQITQYEQDLYGLSAKDHMNALKNPSYKRQLWQYRKAKREYEQALEERLKLQEEEDAAR